MASLKARLAAFKQAASQDNTPKKEKIVIPKTAAAVTPKKLDMVKNVVTPNSTPKRKPVIDIHAKQTPRTGVVSDKAKTACVTPSPNKNQNWDYLYELALQFDQLKLQEAEEAKTPPKRAISPPKPHAPGDKKNIKNALEGIMGGNFTANGNFLTEEYIGKHLIENKKFNCLTFDFTGQSKLFKRFDRKDAERKNICRMFVDALLKHPRSSEITALQMANALLPDDFLEILAERCIADPNKNLPKLRVLNMESNLLAEEGIIALSKAIADPRVWRNLQCLKLENQKMPITSHAEEALAEAILQSPSLVVVSLSVRGGLERQQINNTVAANIDNLRQARRHHAEKTGTLQERKRNEMEQYFDKIAENDPSITDVDIVGNIKYLGLNSNERTKTGAAFANNTHVKTIKMVKLQLDDAFAEAFGKAIAKNSTIQKVVIDSNAFSGAGIKSLLEGLGQNSSIVEFQVHHQSKTTSSSDEKSLPALLAPNKTIIKLGVDLRDQMTKMQIDRKLNENQEYQRKMRAAQKKK